MTMKFEEKCGDNGSLVGRNQSYPGEKHQPKGKPITNGEAEFYAKQEANGKCSVPRKSLNMYTWQEIQRHNQEADQWLVINRKVYNVSSWADRHPGGRRVLNHYAGEDATDVFRAMHPEPDIVQLYLKPLLIGELAPGEHSQERHKNAQSSFLQHDVGHLSIFKKSKWNHVMHKFVMCHLKGLSANWWNYRHFQHHVKPNIYPKDPDIDMGPLFLLGDSQPVKYGKKKIKYINYEKQHLYFYMVGLPLLMPVYFNLQSMQVMYLRRYWVDIAWVSSFYIRYFITFGPYYGIFGTVLLIYLVKFLESPWIAYVTQMSHIPMRMSTEENRDWLSTQVLATCNIEQSFFNDWFTGHLNFQIEHHLFPTMPRHNYHKVAPLVRSLCAKHGLQYVNKPMLRAFGDIVRALKKSAALWVDAYYET
ncbi:putative fatty acid desaturase 2-like protein FADS2B isoform X2 [Macaca fascicularis]|uniref:putative fatty acid desaturase 2-like protein FADS2B isoform X2 n=1 Tax=Macaca fascicularis TaxID=9541 RepID=UPI001E2566F8|nr:putative fatty acid desaturase 2-like protein FADS2B isoform X2 [Macaca fascicularis]